MTLSLIWVGMYFSFEYVAWKSFDLKQINIEAFKKIPDDPIQMEMLQRSIGRINDSLNFVYHAFIKMLRGGLFPPSIVGLLIVLMIFIWYPTFFKKEYLIRTKESGLLLGGCNTAIKEVFLGNLKYIVLRTGSVSLFISLCLLITPTILIPDYGDLYIDGIAATISELPLYVISSPIFGLLLCALFFITPFGFSTLSIIGNQIIPLKIQEGTFNYHLKIYQNTRLRNKILYSNIKSLMILSVTSIALACLLVMIDVPLVLPTIPVCSADELERFRALLKGHFEFFLFGFYDGYTYNYYSNFIFNLFDNFRNL